MTGSQGIDGCGTGRRWWCWYFTIVYCIVMIMGSSGHVRVEGDQADKVIMFSIGICIDTEVAVLQSELSRESVTQAPSMLKSTSDS